ncbi:MAG: hypothetical protein RSA62_05790 [Oscillospiraceae bacterium]
MKIITAADIANAINRLLIAKWPKRTVYRGFVPKDFLRPSFLIEAVQEKRRSANVGLLRSTVYFTVTAFIAADEYKNMDAGALLEIQGELLNLFREEKLFVFDRALNISASGGGLNEGECYIDLQLEFVDCRSNAIDTTPIMGGVETTIKLEG